MGNHHAPHGAVSTTLTAVCLILLFFTSFIDSARSDDNSDIIETSETCLDCHEGQDQTLHGTTHQLTSTEDENPKIVVGCISCHDGWEEHLEDPGIGTISNPATALPSHTEATCTACHQPHMEAGVVGQDPHFMRDFSCSNCHSVHNGSEFSLLLDGEAQFCSNCHTAVVDEFRKRSNHPLTDEALTCVDCHSFAGEGEPDFGHGGNVNCYKCHPQQSGPWVFEHEATSSFSTQGGEGCISCHNPHGSPIEPLLARSGDLLCLQCHTTPPLHKTQHDGIATMYACVECHSDVHGSHTNRNFLDPQLGAIVDGEPNACFCHQIQ